MLWNHYDWCWLVKGFDYLYLCLCEFLADWDWLRVLILVRTCSQQVQGLLNGIVFGDLVNIWERSDGLGIQELITCDDLLSICSFHVLRLRILCWSYAEVSGSSDRWLHHFNGNRFVNWVLFFFIDQSLLILLLVNDGLGDKGGSMSCWNLCWHWMKWCLGNRLERFSYTLG